MAAVEQMSGLIRAKQAPTIKGRPIRIEYTVGFSTGYFSRIDGTVMWRTEVVKTFSTFRISNVWPPTQTELSACNLTVGWFVEFETHGQFLKALKVSRPLTPSTIHTDQIRRDSRIPTSMPLFTFSVQVLWTRPCWLRRPDPPHTSSGFNLACLRSAKSLAHPPSTIRVSRLFIQAFHLSRAVPQFKSASLPHRVLSQVEPTSLPHRVLSQVEPT
jgi:hypothetical protein